MSINISFLYRGNINLIVFFMSTYKTNVNQAMTIDNNHHDSIMI